MSATNLPPTPEGYLAFCRTMHSMLRREASAEVTAAALGAATERLLIYQRFVRGHVARVLGKDFSTLAEVLGPSVWEDLVQRFFEEYPPSHPELNANAEPFVDLLFELAQEPGSPVHLVHGDLALVEWAEWEAYSDPRPAVAPPEAPRPALNPTLSILELSYPLAEFLTAWRAATSPDLRPEIPTAPEPEQLLVYRHPETELAHYLVPDEATLFAFKVAYERMSVDDAARAASLAPQVVETVLARVEETGILSRS